MKYIKLTQNKRAIVDNEDFYYISQWKWFYSMGYAMRNKPMIKGKRQGMEQMHRVINKTPKGFETDHINRNRLDNRKSNLRTVTTQLNQRNASLSKNNKSGYIGVHFYKRVSRWMAYIWKDYKKIHLGYFLTAKEASVARKNSERIYWND